MKAFFDFFPVLFFFLTFKFYDSLPDSVIAMANQLPFVDLTAGNSKDAIFMATLVIIIATILQNIAHWFVYRRLEKMHLISLGILLIFGTLTLILKNPDYIAWKVTIFNWIFAGVILGSFFVGEKTLIERMMSHAISVPKQIWKKVNLSWGLFFIIVGALNLIVYEIYAKQMDNLDAWVNFKMFGILGLTLVFMIGQGLYIAKHAEEIEETEEVKK
ncbi:MAG TPA: septation protein A [Leucothrix mucor]|uniref:Inner membrane-spanning protein YciB n=1 Tax=Leucothrix mucor TaxID=45248 RepID=A0A7V2WU88_LEUMU|nr:septation protein A [Leucothrix mucor]